MESLGKMKTFEQFVATDFRKSNKLDAFLLDGKDFEESNSEYDSEEAEKH